MGHKYGYRSFDNGDQSRNTLPSTWWTMGELFQNNHHKTDEAPTSRLAVRDDPTWQVMRLSQGFE